MAKSPTPLGLRIRLVLGRDVMIGPGKAHLLEGIRDTGSIAAAGRRMGMSYKRAWTLVEGMNAAYRAPLVATARGGAGHGGASLTPLGLEVLAAYRGIRPGPPTPLARRSRRCRPRFRTRPARDETGGFGVKGLRGLNEAAARQGDCFAGGAPDWKVWVAETPFQTGAFRWPRPALFAAA